MYFCTATTLLLAITGLSEQQDSGPKIFCKERPFNISFSGPYNSNTEKCCLGTLLSKGTGAEEQCCGSSAYDKSKALCCDHQVTPSQPGHQCCGSKSYNPDTSICCRGQVLDVSGEDAKNKYCCGDKVFDSKTQTCCAFNGVYGVHDKKEGHMCCEDKLYDRNTQVCCTETSRDQPIISQFIVTKDDSSLTSCCGRNLINPQAQRCCNGKAFDIKTQDCCGDQVYDIESEVCCGTSIAKKTDPAQNLCCAGTPYDSKKEQCCRGTNKLITKTNEADNDCCGDVTWNIWEASLCCNGVLYKNIPTTNGRPPRPFGPRMPNWLKQKCCGSNLVDNTKNSDEDCCGFTDAYNKKTQLCCSDPKTLKNKVVDKGTVEGNVGCCSLQAYNRDTQVCCSSQGGEKIIDRNTDTSYEPGCCGFETYNMKTQMCCRDYSNNTARTAIFDKPQDEEPTEEYLIRPVFGCCDLKPFAHSKAMCCGGEIVAKTGNNACCGSTVYEKDEKICCAFKLFPRTEGQNSCCFAGTTDEFDDCVMPYKI